MTVQWRIYDRSDARWNAGIVSQSHRCSHQLGTRAENHNVVRTDGSVSCDDLGSHIHVCENQTRTQQHSLRSGEEGTD